MNFPLIELGREREKSRERRIAREGQSDDALTFRPHTPRSPGVGLEHTHPHTQARTLLRIHMRSLAMANATPVIISLAAFSRYVPRSQCQLQRGLCGSCNVCGPTEILNQNCAHSTSSSHFVCRVELMKMAARHGTARLGKQR